MRITLFYLLLFSSICSYADQPTPQKTNDEKVNSYTPFYSGTLLAFFSQNVSPGLFDIEPYFFQTTISGFYSNNWSFEKTKPTHDLAATFYLETGITKYVDITLLLNAIYNQYSHFHSLLYQDMQAYLGFQILTDTKGTWIPDVRILVGENFPTGTYQDLDPAKSYSDSSGVGAYSTNFTFVTKKIFYTDPKHPFNICLNLQYFLSNKTNVKGYNVYGGTFDTKGTISPGNGYMVNLSGEFSFTQNLVIGTDIHYLHQNKSTFSGNSGTQNPFVGAYSYDQLSIAPCLEYNFTINFGIFFASWFTVAGRNSDRFITNSISAYWVF